MDDPDETMEIVAVINDSTSESELQNRGVQGFSAIFARAPKRWGERRPTQTLMIFYIRNEGVLHRRFVYFLQGIKDIVKLFLICDRNFIATKVWKKRYKRVYHTFYASFSWHHQAITGDFLQSN